VRRRVLNVFLTVDTEVWCGGWSRLDEVFPRSFRQYVYGDTPDGPGAMPLKLQILGDHGLHAVFFVEPLFALRFGTPPLAEIVDMIGKAGQEVQLHLHTEWVDEAPGAVLPPGGGKRQNMRDFSRDEQAQLLARGRAMLESAGAGPIAAFRAGNYGLNRDTLRALSATGFQFDSSFNRARHAGDASLSDDGWAGGSAVVEGVWEFPVTVFRDGRGRDRPLQIGACSFEEMQDVLSRAAGDGWSAAVIVSHNFELMNQRRDRVDPIAARRFRKLCELLDRRRDLFRTAGFRDLSPASAPAPARALGSSVGATAKRVLEQAWRRTYR